MNIILHKSEDRGRADYGWLKTRYSFSFANWHNDERMGFGVLRVLNDDIVAPSTGFDLHEHANMEIITVVTRGFVTHQDSMGNTRTISAGMVQVMSAGTGVRHSEHNFSKTEPLELFQIWIEPKKRDVVPSYAEFDFKLPEVSHRVLLVSPKGEEESLPINQDAYIEYVNLKDTAYTYTLRNEDHGVYVFVIEGSIEIDGQEISSRDAAGITNAENIQIKNSTGAVASFFVIEVPL